MCVCVCVKGPPGQFGPRGAQGPSGGQVNTHFHFLTHVHVHKHSFIDTIVVFQGPPGRPGVRGQPGAVGEKVNRAQVMFIDLTRAQPEHHVTHVMMIDRVKRGNLEILDLWESQEAQ